MLSVAVMNSMTFKSNLGRKRLIWLLLSGYSLTLVEVRAGTEVETLENVSLLAWSLLMVFFELSCTI